VVKRTVARRVAGTTAVTVAAIGIGLVVHANASSTPSASSTPGTAQQAAVTLPPVNAKFDYQIGEAYRPPSGVTVISRDREADPVAGLYNICYVNAFQVQPAEATWWKRNHDDLLLRDASGGYVVDDGWDEHLLDISTPAKRTAIARIVNGWIDGCAVDGFQAVEPDNIDSYDRSKGRLTITSAIEYLKLLSSHAHGAGLAIGQKNTTELGTRGKSAGLDFAIAEECGRVRECGDYTNVYGNNVIDIEYTDRAYREACKAVGAKVSVVRRDEFVTAPGSDTYIYKAC
jgi:hypothetical protein